MIVVLKHPKSSDQSRLNMASLDTLASKLDNAGSSAILTRKYGSVSRIELLACHY
jgi:hypothetical protein